MGKVYSTGPGGRIDRRSKETWDPVAMSASTTVPLAPGKYRIDLAISGTELTLRVNDTFEVRGVAALPAGAVWRPAIVVQRARARIRNVTLR
jgi:hypothetical protein